MKTNKISLFDLYEIKRTREIKNVNVFNHILDICYKKIKQTAEFGKMSLYYKVPPIIIGYPLYDLDECINYIADNLKKSGLCVMNISQSNKSYLYISWKIDEISNKAKNKLLLE
jgi:hypothetical protein